MRRFLLGILLSVLASSVSGAQPLTASGIRAGWESRSIPVAQPDITGFAQAFAECWKGQALCDVLSDTLAAHPGECMIFWDDVAGSADAFLNIDRENGRLTLDYSPFDPEDDWSIRNFQMALWPLKEGKVCVMVKLYEEAEYAAPLMLHYTYDPQQKVLRPDSVPALPSSARLVNFNMPALGQDIVLHFKGGSRGLLVPDGQGGFKGEMIPRTPSSTVDELLWGCFITDTEPTNVRYTPRGRICCQLPLRDDWNLEVTNPVGGWWRLPNGMASTEEAEDFVLAYTDLWIHSSVIGLRVQNDDGRPELLYSKPDPASAVAGEIREARAVVHPYDLKWGSDHDLYVQVRYGQLSGWLRQERLGR